MGKILLQVPLDEITNVDFEQINTSYMDSDDFFKISRSPNSNEIMNIFYSKNLPPEIQYIIWDELRGGLSRDNVISIITNSENINTNLMNSYLNIPIEVLLENAHKFNLHYIEKQENINAEFVELHFQDMDRSSFFHYHQKTDTLLNFLDSAKFREYFKKHLSYKYAITEDLVMKLAEYPEFNIDTSKIHEAFNTEISIPAIRRFYDGVQRRHGVNAILDYYRRNYRNSDEPRTWREFIDDSTRRHENTLVEIFWDEFMREIIFPNLAE